MCGIAGRILNAPGKVGYDLVELMHAQEHRGADSTGFAIYGIPRDSGYVVRAMGFERECLSEDLEDFHAILKEHGSDFVDDPTWDDTRTRHYSVRMTITDPVDVARWTKAADEICERLEVQSVGRSLEIIKDTGGSYDVADKHGVRDMIGTHGLGHARLATESDVRPNASHPFWARPFPDVAIVHNGQITDYYTWRNRLEHKGYRFLTYNDSELIAVWVSDQMKGGLSMEQALSRSIDEIDGVFTFMISRPDKIGFAKDRFAMKPLVVVNENGEIAAATEEQAVRRVFEDDDVSIINYDGPCQKGIWGVGNRRAAA
ncbi:amidophosphoribosyltransferase [Sulfitobacter sp. JB4-11]|uniref:amidophosphoribosyltransferase n=1 Tax=Sulfitobacter rhodophyticola TaxID=3238304 RepID=UPI003512F400